MPSASIASNLLSEINNLPDKPPRSKLEPHRDLIRELRRKGRTYRELSRIFQERLDIYVAPSTLHSFVKVRAKHRKRTQFELPAIEAVNAQSPTLDPIAVLKAKPSVKTGNHGRFVFREHEPLTLTGRGGKQ